MNRPRTSAALAALGILTAAASLTSPAVASAGQPSGDRLQENVYYSLSELSTPWGTAKVYRRITRAAEEVCPGFDSNDDHAVAASKECQRHAIERAIAHVGSERLAALDAQVAPYRG